METIYLFTPLYTRELESKGYEIKVGRKFKGSYLKKDDHFVNVYFDEDENGTYVDTINMEDDDKEYVKELLKEFNSDFLCDFEMRWYMSYNDEHRTDETLKKLIARSKDFLK